MIRRLLPVFITSLLVFSYFAFAGSDKESGFDLRILNGRWEGEGEVLIPKTSIPLSIEGSAAFTYDSTSQRLRTTIEASRFFFAYADSGYLYHDQKTDSIIWEVWDGFGKYCKYLGKVENNVITAGRAQGEKIYRISIDFITADSLSFGLSTTYPDGESSTRAAINLWRIK